jgi:hypothetical protein
MTSPVASAVTTALPPDSGIRVGVVTVVESTSAITVNIGGGIITGMPFINSYLPAVGDNVQIVRMDATWICIGRIGFYPGGTVGGVRATSTTTVVTSGTTELDLPFLGFTTHVQDDHVYEIFVRMYVTMSVANDVFEIRIRRDTALAGTEMSFNRFTLPVTTGVLFATGWGIYESPTTETFPIFISVVRVTGTGTLTIAPRAAGGNAQLSSYARMTDVGLGLNVSGTAWSH